MFSEFCSISALSCSFEFVWWVGGGWWWWFPSDYLVSTQPQLWLFFCWGRGFFSIETPLFRQATFYLAELFRQGTFYLAELFRQTTFYLAELSCQIPFSYIKTMLNVCSRGRTVHINRFVNSKKCTID